MGQTVVTNAVIAKRGLYATQLERVRLVVRGDGLGVHVLMVRLKYKTNKSEQQQ